MDLQALEHYLEKRSGTTVRIREVRQLGSEDTGEEALKQFGFGKPVLVVYSCREAEKRIVFHRIRRNAFGREREDDRVAAVWLDFKTFGRLPRHVPALDMVLRAEEELESIGQADELLLTTAYRSGHLYAGDLAHIRDEGRACKLDFRRVEALAKYLAQIHALEHDDPMLWSRRLRDLVGHGEGIMGLTDSYPDRSSYTSKEELIAIEEAVSRWRWRLKPMSHRLRQVHGDFHPFNVLFEEDVAFHVLDRSRGEWGEPADDVSCMTINYIFFSLQRSGLLDGDFQALHERFWETYLSSRPDDEMAAVIQPWYAWRALVLASPTWYPNISAESRRKILNFAKRILSLGRYEYREVNRYLEDA